MPKFYIEIETTRKNAEYIAHELIAQETALLTEDEIIKVADLEDQQAEQGERRFFKTRGLWDL